MEDLARLRYENVSLRSPATLDTNLPRINEIYSLYKHVWETENQDLYQIEDACSESLFLNDTAQCLYNDDKLISSNLTRHANLKAQHHLDQKWLACWPEETIEQVIHAYGHNVIIGNHLTVSPDFRRSSAKGTNIAAVFAMLISMQIAETNEVYLGEMRTSRSVQQLGKLCGAITLNEGFSVYGVTADLVVFPGSGIKDVTQKFPSHIIELYRRGKGNGPHSFRATA
jgi:hypothetical protein